MTPPEVRPLRTPLFRTLTVGWALANFADSLLTLILAVWVTDLTGSPILGGATFAMLGLPALASPFIGHLVDRVSRRRMLVIAYIVGALCLVPLFWVDDASGLWMIYLGTVIYATVAYVTGACQSGILKDTLPSSALGQANGILSMIDQVFRVAMPFVGAALYAWTGMTLLLALTIGAFLLAAFVFTFVRIMESHADPVNESLGKALLAGFRHLFGVRPLGPLAWSMLVAMAAIGLVNGVAFAVLDHLDLPAAWLGPLTVGQGIGGFLAGAFAPKLMDRFGRVTVYALGIIALGLGLLPLAGDSVILMLVSQLVVGFAATASIISFVTERQIVTPERLQGRVATASQVVMNLPGVVVTAGAAAALAIVDFRVLIVLTVILLVLAGFASLRYRRERTPEGA